MERTSQIQLKDAELHANDTEIHKKALQIEQTQWENAVLEAKYLT